MSTTPITVCFFCCSEEPEVPSPSCAHGAAVTLSTSQAQELAAKIADARRGLLALEHAFRLTVQAGATRGSARFNDRPAVVSPGDTVVFLRERPVIVDPEGRPVSIASHRSRRLP
jgi:hypothetical protein